MNSIEQFEDNQPFKNDFEKQGLNSALQQIGITHTPVQRKHKGFIFLRCA